MFNPFDPGFFCSEELRELGFAEVGENVRISRDCTIIGLHNICIGDDVRIDSKTAIIATGECRLGSFIHIGGFCHIVTRGGFEMGDFSGLSQRVSIYTASDDYSGRHMTNPTVPESLTGCTVLPVRIGRHAIVGANSVVLPGAHLGEGVAMGAMSLATRPLDDWGVYVGQPAVRRSERQRRCLSLEAEMMKVRAVA